MHFSKGLGGLKMSHLWTNTTSFEVEGKGLGANLAVLSLWLFRTVRLLNLSLVIVERSHVYKSTFLLLSLIAHAGSTSTSVHCRFL